MKHIVLGVTGSIAAYKAADLAHQLHKLGYGVHVVMTRAAQEFVTPLTFQTLTGQPVATDLFQKDRAWEVAHIALAKQADLVLIAPATANVIGKLANGIADDMLTTIAMAAWRKPLLLCPAMNTAMYENPAHQENLARLLARGAEMVEPKSALLACGDTGKGAMAEVSDIVAAVRARLEG